MIKQIDNLNREAYNPIRPHINIHFERCKSEVECLEYIADHLPQKRFDPDLSRVLVFVRTRRQAENASGELVKLLPKSLKNKVGYFHAGLGADERDGAVRDFREGRKVILFTTKAFGMGMDIPNIHFVFHLGPSSTFEDFLQEIGRAGRNRDALDKAGLSEQNPIQTICLLTNQDFPKLKDLLQRTQLSWSQVQDLFGALKRLFEEHRLATDTILPLPLSYYTQVEAFEEDSKSGGAETNFRLALHWLERLKRIELGFFLPAHLEFDNIPIAKHKDNYQETISDPNLKSLFGLLLEKADLEQPFTILSLTTLKSRIAIKTTISLFKVIALGQKNGCIKLNHNVKISVPNHRQDETKYAAKIPINTHPNLDILFRLAEQFLKQVALGQELELDGEYTNQAVKVGLEELFTAENFPWLRPIAIANQQEQKREWEKKVKKVREAFAKKGRGGYAKGLNGVFQVIRSVPGVKQRIIFKDQSISQIIQRYSKKTDKEIDEYLRDLRKDCYWLLNYVYEGNRNTTHFSIQIVEVLNKLTQPDIRYFETILNLLQRTRLIQVEGTLLPMAIELKLKNNRDIDPNGDRDDQRIQSNFFTAQKLRRVRLAVLAGFAEIPPDDYNAYINEYFQCENYDKIVQLLDKFLPANSQLLSEFRDEALNKAEEDLNPQQRAVYDFNIHNNLNVVAGPGSGKTHTLTLRVARLIHKEHIQPSQILVLAYNRAVVVELKERLRKLFRQLGYNKLTSSLKVFTFHGFIKYCLQDELEGVDFKDYPARFINKWQTEPGLINARMGPIRYVFVDEFQDITSSRLNVLEIIANPAQQRYITVIGDPNQSIYGFDRKAEGDPISPKPFYSRFNDFFKPEELQLTTNYRSLPQIIDQAQQFLNLNVETFNIPPLTANNEVPTTWATKEYCQEIQPSNDNWITTTQQLLNESTPDGHPYRELAIMYRSNDELYRGFNKLKSQLPVTTRVRIQGETDDFLRIREIAFVIDGFIKPKLEQPVANQLHAEYKDYLASSATPVSWDRYLLDTLEACLIEFEKDKSDEATYRDLLEFLQDIARKDDGQLGKFYHQNANRLSGYSNQTTIVLTTMHKVKGLEFDAVLIPPSYVSLPYVLSRESPSLPSDPGFEDSIEEERRLRFVALSRAKLRLIDFPWNREKALVTGEAWSLLESQRSKMGRPARAGLDKFYIDWVATQSPQTFEFIQHNVRVGDEVVLTSYYDKWNIWVNGRIVARTKAGGMKGFLGSEIRGFSVTNVLVRYYEDTALSDQKNGTTFAEKWQEHAKQIGYTYIVDFAGYGKTI